MTEKLTLGALAGAVIAVSVLVAGTKAMAHEAPLGWSYAASCCDNRDCREIKSEDIAEVPGGYHIKISTKNEIVPYGSSKIKDSPDGLFHWCSYGGLNSGGTICLYVPPRGY